MISINQYEMLYYHAYFHVFFSHRDFPTLPYVPADFNLALIILMLFMLTACLLMKLCNMLSQEPLDQT